MRILFCNDSFPGNFEALAGLLAADSANEVLFLSTFVRKDFSIPGVSRVRLRLNRDRGSQEKDAFFLAWEKAYRVGRQTSHTLLHLRESGFVPDMILASSADGPGLFLRHVFPESFIVSYLDRYRGMPTSPEERGRMEASLSLQSCQLGQSNLYFIASEWQRKLFSPLLQKAVRVMPCFVDTDLFSVEACSRSGVAALMEHDSELISFHVRDDRKDSISRLLFVIAEVLSRRVQCHVAVCTGLESARHAWEQATAVLPAQFRRRVSVVKFALLSEYRDFLCASSIHVFPDVNATPSHEILECMSCSALVLVPSGGTGDSFLHPGENCLNWPGQQGRTQASAVCSTLDSREKFTSLRKGARDMAVNHYGQGASMSLYGE